MMWDLAFVLMVLAVSFAIFVCWWLLMANYRLAARNEAQRRQIGLLQLACDDSRTMFSRYAAIHHEKNTPEGDKKAQSNAAMAASLSKVLQVTGFDGLGPMQKATLALRRAAGENLRVG